MVLVTERYCIIIQQMLYYIIEHNHFYLLYSYVYIIRVLLYRHYFYTHMKLLIHFISRIVNTGADNLRNVLKVMWW